MHQEDAVDQRITILLFSLNILYVALACGVRFASVALPLLVPSSFSSPSTPFCALPSLHLETPEPRYVLVCFPGLIALAAQLFLPRPPTDT